MKLGELIKLLETRPAGESVRFSDGTVPRRFTSWRGVYAQLSLTPDGSAMTCGKLLVAAKAADGGTFQGWKGGDFKMDRDTPVWADDAGDADHFAILGSTVDDSGLVLTRCNVADYFGW